MCIFAEGYVAVEKKTAGTCEVFRPDGTASYVVDMVTGTCSCPSFHFGGNRDCKHLSDLRRMAGIEAGEREAAAHQARVNAAKASIVRANEDDGLRRRRRAGLHAFITQSATYKSVSYKGFTIHAAVLHAGNAAYSVTSETGSVQRAEYEGFCIETALANARRWVNNHTYVPAAPREEPADDECFCDARNAPEYHCICHR